MGVTTKEIIRYYERYIYRDVDLKVSQDLLLMIEQNKDKKLFTDEEVQYLWEIYMSMDILKISYPEFRNKLKDERKIWGMLKYKGFLGKNLERREYHNTVVLQSHLTDIAGKLWARDGTTKVREGWKTFQEVYGYYTQITKVEIDVEYKENAKKEGEVEPLTEYLQRMVTTINPKEHMIRANEVKDAIDKQIRK